MTFAEWGYPRTAETNDCLLRLVAATKQFGTRAFQPGQILLMDVTTQTNIEPCWSRPELKLTDNTTQPWNSLDNEIRAIAPQLAEIRAALVTPSRHTVINPTNFAQRPNFHFVEQRNAAQWLSADLIHALHQNDLARARDDLHALQQLAHVQEEDLTLVTQMIRVAIAGLALHDTWELLQADGWEDRDLRMIQAGWEQIDLIQNLERGILGERLTAETIFAQLSDKRGSELVQHITTMFGGTRRKDLEYYWEVFVTTPLWQMNRHTDELLSLQHFQNDLDSIRSLKWGSNWLVVSDQLERNSATLQNTLAGTLAHVRYLFSAALIPNTRRGGVTTVHNETLRRLAVAAIALKRYELRHNSFPTTLEALAPTFLSAAPIDPMNGEPLRYRVTEIGYLLYSVGEDGVDNGGDLSAADLSTTSKKHDIWSGKDFVWPNATRRSR